ncbi:GMC oxidoreductase [Geodermatophilus sabuli]|uniref:Cholesterol oxidase n=1 Tax=Geodermatophilus sabuli TaxID=1564158 RepID=A0A285EB56_9ACTN|nr:GMC family oxidoreductase [Geodermatophilus sabuli]MBB3084380.1 cholesterol oxidase [Geodermatophilus sabuli]SNX96352.1 cholesterol oxidase [Geodermatophilus sabuli]
MAETEFVENVVVGSGFGGSVATYRLAAAGRPVLLLERGKAYGPGDFPREPWDVGANFWDPSAGRLGLFDLWSFRRTDALVAAGLGGGSLIYANVLIRKPAEWFVEHRRGGRGHHPWPISRADLDPHYDEVERMLGAQPFPRHAPGFEGVLKTAAMERAARSLGPDHSFHLPDLAVSFRPAPGAAPAVGAPLADTPYANYHGRPRSTCVLCGQCDIGCNSGSKNTLDHTYLSAAVDGAFPLVATPAEVRTLCEVRSVAPDGDGYVVRYVEHPPAHHDGTPHDTRSLPQRTVRCRRLVLAAGTLGTTHLLLRMRRDGELPALSGALGSRFSGNGDHLTVLKRAREDDGRPLPLHASRGPVITSAVRRPDGYIEDCGYPMLLNWVYQARHGLFWRAGAFAAQRIWALLTRDPNSRVGASLGMVLGKGVEAATSMPLLGIGRDVADGRMTLTPGGYLAIRTTRSSRAYVAGVSADMRTLAGGVNAAGFADSVWDKLGRSVTVHPLGGAPMGRSRQEGVCDHFGEVFGYDNLFVADGAVMPGAVGSNPSLTIAAFSDRMCTAVLEGRTRAPLRGTRRRPGTPAAPGGRAGGWPTP